MSEQRDDRADAEDSAGDAPAADTTATAADATATAADATATAADGGADSAAADTDRGSRDVVVPMPLYKTVTVFSTLLAVVGVVGGFVLLDAAVMSGGVVRVAVNALLSVGGVRVSPSVWASLQPVFAVGGLVAIALGAAVYVLGSRFRAEGMGRDDESAAESAATDEE